LKPILKDSVFQLRHADLTLPDLFDLPHATRISINQSINQFRYSGLKIVTRSSAVAVIADRTAAVRLAENYCVTIKTCQFIL